MSEPNITVKDFSSMATESRHHRGQADQCDIKTKHKIKDKKSRNQERGPVVYTTNG